METTDSKPEKSNPWLFLLAIVVVIGCFALSFQIGKMIFIPVKELPANQDQVAGSAAPPPEAESVPEIKIERKSLAGPLAEEAEPETVPASVQPVINKPAPSPAAATAAKTAPGQQPIPSGKTAGTTSAETAAITSYSQTGNKAYKVQIGPYATRERAGEISEQLKSKNYPAFIVATAGGTLWKVQVGSFQNITLAEDLAGQLRRLGYPVTIIAQ